LTAINHIKGHRQTAVLKVCRMTQRNCFAHEIGLYELRATWLTVGRA